MIIVYPDSFYFEDYRVDLESSLEKNSFMDFFNEIDDEFVNEELK